MSGRPALVPGAARGERRTAVLSVADKTGIVNLAAALQAQHWRIFATGGTYRLLRAEGLEARPVAELAGDGEVLGGRVKTLDRSVFCGLLSRWDDRADTADMAARGYRAISLVACHPPALPRSGAWTDGAWTDGIDVGGPAMLRAAAKNHAGVVALTDPGQYPDAIAALAGPDGGLGAASLAWRRDLAAAVFARLSDYDRRIAAAFAETSKGADPA